MREKVVTVVVCRAEVNAMMGRKWCEVRLARVRLVGMGLGAGRERS